MERSTQIINWQGYQIEVRVDPKTYDLNRHNCPHMIHIELRTISPEKAPLPVTETGYRSHFILAEHIAEYESPEAFVLAWLDHAAADKNWQLVETAARQFSLL